MMPRRFPIIITIWLTVIGFALNHSVKSTLSETKVNSSDNLIAQAPPKQQTTLTTGAKGEAVKRLQNNLKSLGYFPGEVNGIFDQKTQQAIVKFQTEQGLQVNGIATIGLQEVVEGILFDQHMNRGYNATQQKDYQLAKQSFEQALKVRPNNLYGKRALGNLDQYIARLKEQERIRQEQEKLKQEREEKLKQNLLIIGLISAVILILLITIIFNFKKRQINKPKSSELSLQPSQNSVTDTTNIVQESDISLDSTTKIVNQETATIGGSLSIQSETSSLNKIDGIEELIKDLKLSKGATRRKAIWELAQRADSRAMQPLVQLMLDADSQERSLILEAISQISTRTLKPLNRALSLSLQDENAQVRLNAIRDLSRIYELIAEVNQRLYHATDDEDPEVREIANWALKNLSKTQLPYNQEEDN